jgi:hypothetical protein
LCNQLGGRVALCPDWHGRVMTSSCDGLDGYSFGLVNVREIDKNENNNTEFGVDINNMRLCGGEDQFTFSPDYGAFSIYDNLENDNSLNEIKSSEIKSGEIKSGEIKSGLSNFSQRGFFEDKFITDSEPPDPEIRMRRSVSFNNRLGTHFDFDISRIVRLIELDEIGEIFGHSVAISLEQIDTSYVAFQTINTVVNRGNPLIRELGLVSIKIRNMLNTGADSVAIIPFRSGQEIELGPNFGVDFFDLASHSQLRKLPHAVLIRSGNRHHCQIGISRNRAAPFLGSVDFRNGNLTLVSFNLPESAWEYDYLSNAFFEMKVEETNNAGFSSGPGVDFVCTRNNNIYNRDCEFVRKGSEFIKSKSPEKSNNSRISKIDQTDNEQFDSLYSGEVVRVYNRGFFDKDVESAFRYCEFDIFSAARELMKGESLSHQQYTLHINADNQTLAFITNEVLGINYQQTYEKISR